MIAAGCVTNDMVSRRARTAHGDARLRAVQFCYSACNFFGHEQAYEPERREPAYLFTEKQVADKSEIARRFLDARTRLNANVDKADNFLVKRFYNLDHNAYLEGAVPAKYKELMGLVASACLRCDDCITTTSSSRIA